MVIMTARSRLAVPGGACGASPCMTSGSTIRRVAPWPRLVLASQAPSRAWAQVDPRAVLSPRRARRPSRLRSDPGASSTARTCPPRAARSSSPSPRKGFDDERLRADPEIVQDRPLVAERHRHLAGGDRHLRRGVGHVGGDQVDRRGGVHRLAAPRLTRSTRRHERRAQAARTKVSTRGASHGPIIAKRRRADAETFVPDPGAEGPGLARRLAGWTNWSG